MKIFSDMLSEHKQKGESTFSGADAFKLYDTYGFPIDLTTEMCADEGMSVDEQGFRALMEEQRQRARKAREALGDLGWAGIEFGKEIPETEFVGYDEQSVEAKVLAIVADGEFREEIPAGTEATVVLDRTVLYAEMGGQVADHGTLTAGGMHFEISDVQKNKGGKFMHSGKLVSGELKLGDTVTAAYDKSRRAAIARAHSATHLLQKALRDVLGEHVHQAGSLVEPDFLRFDFTHFSAVTAEQLQAVEDAVNAAVLEGLDVVTKVMPLEEARKSGATALFGEKYGDSVRVVSMGDYSVELCGGTHLSTTAKAGAFHILSEGSVASGVRRIEASTGLGTLRTLRKDIETIDSVAALFKANPADVLQKVEQQAGELKEAKRLIQQYKDKESAGGADELLRRAKEIGGVHVVTCSQGECDAAALRKMGDALRDKDPSVVALIAAVNGDKITFQCVCGKEAVAKGIRAGDIIKNVTAIAGGKGGGKPDSAMGGGNLVEKLPEALAALEGFVEAKL
ncbi:MAG: alanine--tRNA ligase, partial [Desulfovibrio sp.]|nr:alanine--tRNA ligase [Desulfovibrio sp.]